MRIVQLFVLLLLGLTSGCRSGLAPEAEIIVGQWVTESESLSPSGSSQHHLVLSANRRFSAEVRSYGVYPGQTGEELSSFTRHEGKFHVRGSSIRFEPLEFVWWDSFYGSMKPAVERPSPYRTLFDQATFEIQGPFLTLNYLSYPLHTPVPTQKTYRRDNL